MAIVPFFIIMVFMLGFFALFIILQIFLSKKESKWPGLVLPLISFSLSLLLVFLIAAYSIVQTDLQNITVYYDTVIIQLDEIYETHTARAVELEEMRAERLTIMETNMQEADTSFGMMHLLRVLFIFLPLNIPTAVFLIIYVVCRPKQKNQRALQMMSLQDLG